MRANSQIRRSREPKAQWNYESKLVQTGKCLGLLETDKTNNYDDEEVSLEGGTAVTHRNEHLPITRLISPGPSTTTGASVHQHYLER